MVSTAKLFEEDLITNDIDSLEIQRARRFSRHFLDEDLAVAHRALARVRATNGLKSSEESPS
jgi:hypothetical protein